MVNSQDGDGLADALPCSVILPTQHSKDSTTTKDIQVDVLRLTVGLQKLDQESKDMRVHQKNLDSLLATKIAAHMEPIREEMNSTFLNQQRKFGVDLE